MKVKTTTAISREDFAAITELAEVISEITGVPIENPSEYPEESIREIEIDPELFTKIADLLRLAKPFMSLIKGYGPILKKLVKIKEEVKTSSL